MHNGGTVGKPKAGVIFDGTFDGFLTIVHSFYYQKLCPAAIADESSFQQELGLTYTQVTTDHGKAATVAEGFRQKCGPDCFQTLYAGFLHRESDRLMDLFSYVIAGFKLGPSIDQKLTWPFVLKTHYYAGNTLREAHLFKGFLRFKNTTSGVFYAELEPENHILPLIADHFTDRLMNERWIIYDKKRKLAAVYDTQQWAIYDAPAGAMAAVSQDEDQFQALWTAFYEAIAIQERKSDKRQKQMLPLRYRKHMTEFKSTR